ncbi:MAG: polysaccharide lyase family 1 protein [Sphingobacteriales bacterium]
MKHIYLLSIISFFSFAAFGQQLSFPGAEGCGRFASGGRGGSVYKVTNLNDSGDGSFRNAVSQPRRTVIFDVSGVIKIHDKIKVAPDITIAGQTAPGAGITVYGNSISFSGNSIVRYMRFRGSDNMPRGACVVVADSLDKLILDHVSIEWGRWDDLHIKNSTNITLQYCLVADGIDPQRFGSLIENPRFVTIHHCLWADNQSRNPKAKAKIEYVNNIVYNWGVSGLVGGHSAEDHYQDIAGNYFIAGPNSNSNFLAMFTATDHVYQRDNMVDMNKDGILNGRAVTIEDFVKEKATLLSQPTLLTTNDVKIGTPEDAYKIVIAQAGASLHRDEIDNRILGYVTSLGKTGKIIHSVAEAGGQPELAEVHTNLKDRDGDGMPDGWEIANYLNPNDAADAQAVKTSGYSNLEIYLNRLVKM